MSPTIDTDKRFQRNLTWQIEAEPDYHELSKVEVIIKEGGVLRRCKECGCAMLQHSHVRIAGAETVERCASCGNLETE